MASVVRDQQPDQESTQLTCRCCDGRKLSCQAMSHCLDCCWAEQALSLKCKTCLEPFVQARHQRPDHIVTCKHARPYQPSVLVRTQPSTAASTGAHCRTQAAACRHLHAQKPLSGHLRPHSLAQGCGRRACRPEHRAAHSWRQPALQHSVSSRLRLQVLLAVGISL